MPMLATATLPSFQLFGSAHLTVLTLTVVLAATLVVALRRWGTQPPLLRGSLLVLAWALLLSFPAKIWAFSTLEGPLLENALPMHLCNWAAVLGFLAIVFRRQIFCELLYFWGLAGTLQAVITPNVPVGFPHPVFIVFFIIHGGVVIAAVAVVFGLRRYPRPGGALRALAWAQLYLLVAGLTNVIAGTNYGFLRAKPETASMLDYFGDWPYYILMLELAALIFFSLLALPFEFLRRLDQRKPLSLDGEPDKA